ncbi:MAG TPA: hypothetical protein VMJ10_08510 [Kofleriaceae bacterium]|nr:hypothetical protein [Kofleriaceae bacterium]
MRSAALAVALVLAAAPSVRADPDFELGRSQKGRRWQIGQGTETVLLSVDAKARAASWDSSFHDDDVRAARAEREQELGGAIVVASIVTTALGISMVAQHRHVGDGLAMAGGGWIGLGVGSFVVAYGQSLDTEGITGGRRRRHHR